MANTGPKTRFGTEQRKAIAEMLDRGMSQAEIARALGTTQPTISRIAKQIKREGVPVAHDTNDPRQFVASFDSKLECLIAIGQNSAGRVSRSALEWRDSALRAYRERVW
jgi:transcriptional regulator